MTEYPFYLNAESITVDSDEGRATLEIVDAESGKRLTVNIHDCDLDAFYDQVKSRIGPYLQEKEEARQEFKRGVMERRTERLAEAYGTSDPKHPDWHSIHADIWDAREGK